MIEDSLIIGLFIILIGIIAIVIYKHRCNNTISKLFYLTFVIYWLSSLFISLFNPFNLYPVSTKTYLLLLLVVISFIVGFSCIKEPKNKNYSYNNKSLLLTIQNVSKSKWYLFFIVIGIILSYKIFSEYSLLIIVANSMDAMDIVESTNKGSLSWLLYSFLCPPLYFCAVIITAVSLIYNRKWKIIIPSICYIVFYSFVGSARNRYLIILIGFFFAYCLKNILGKNVKIPKWIYGFGIILIGIVYVMMAYLSVMRLNYTELDYNTFLEGCDIVNENLITYSLLPFRLFDYALENRYYEKIGDNFGLTTLDGLNRYCWMVLNKFGISIELITDKVTTFFQDTWIYVSPEKKANYAYTCAMYFYLDFKTFGVFLFSFIFGIYIHIIINQFNRTPSVPGLCLIFFLYYVVLQSIFTWYLNKPYALAFLILFTWLSFHHKSENKKTLTKYINLKWTS